MRSKRCSFPNVCPLPPRQKSIKKYDDGTYGFAYYDFRFCPHCGNLMPYALKKLNSFFEVYNLHPVLADALKLFDFRNHPQEKSGCDLHGFDLATKSREYEFWSYHSDLKWGPHFSVGTCCDATGSDDLFSSSGVLYYSFMASLLWFIRVSLLRSLYLRPGGE